MRLTSEFFVSALVRRCNTENAFAVVASRGAVEAGVIVIMVDRLDGRVDLYTPAPQSVFDESTSGSRLFECRLKEGDREQARAIITSEQRIDPDIWVVEVEDREGRVFWDVVAG